jgi:hypothetical protein
MIMGPYSFCREFPEPEIQLDLELQTISNGKGLE